MGQDIQKIITFFDKINKLEDIEKLVKKMYQKEIPWLYERSKKIISEIRAGSHQ